MKGAYTAESVLLDAETYLDARDLASALEGFNAAERLGADPDRCSAGRWMAAMLRGDFSSAWRESDAIRLRGAPDPHRFWNGEDIRGKRLVVRCLHGFGDAVQFLRYAPALRSMASELTFEVAPRFVETARCFEGVENVVTWGEGGPRLRPGWEAQMEVMELPYFFRTELGDLPVAEKYLKPPEHVVWNIAKQIGTSSVPRVGVVWSAGQWNPARGVPFEKLESLLSTADCEFWNLQGAEGDQQRCDLFREADACREDILTLAGLISRLDLVLTVDTLAAHLAGALGVPAWVMLPYAADWRWMTNTAWSPWYPSLRLFRQPRPDDWASVIADVGRALDTWPGALSKRLIA